MDGNTFLHDMDSHDWLLARSATLRDRVHRVRLRQSREHDPAPRDVTDAAMLRDNDRILRSIEESARRELVQVEHALTCLARKLGGH